MEFIGSSGRGQGRQWGEGSGCAAAGPSTAILAQPAGGDGPARGDGDPPFANRGGETTDGVSVDVDFLTMSVPSGPAQVLLRNSVMEEVGYGGRGFKRSERRLVVGGKAWRRLEPIVESKDWALDYECWEYDGIGARDAARVMRALPGRPSRVDIAFDLPCSGTLTSRDVLEHFRPHVVGLGLVIEANGDERWPTCYIGGKQSGRRVRIYRKDLEDLEVANCFGPTMRIELVLRDEAAQAWWSVWRDDEGRGFAAAAAHLQAMTGYCLMTGGEIPPSRVLDGSSGLLGKFLACFRQYGGLFEAAIEAGADLGQFGELVRAQSVKRSRSGTWRVQRDLREIQRIGLGEVFGSVLQCLSSGSGRDESSPA